MLVLIFVYIWFIVLYMVSVKDARLYMAWSFIHGLILRYTMIPISSKLHLAREK